MNKQKMVMGAVTATVIAGGLLLYNKNQAHPPKTSGNLNPIEAVYAALSPQAKKLYYEQSEGLTEEVPDRLVELDQLTIGCFAPAKVMNMSAADTNLGGQCCGVLKDVEAYSVQLKALERFIEKNGNIDLIPRDPYEVTVEDAQELIAFDQSIRLNEEQQKLYDEAVQKSHHGGPCCCKCWKWYQMSGLAKKLIVDYGWTADQIAELWDTSSSCGHDHDTNMHQHYDVSPGEESSHGHDHATETEQLSARVTLKTNPVTLVAGEQAKLTLSLRDEGGTPIEDLITHHARTLHVVIIDEQKEVFGHVHPEDFEQSGNAPGEYRVFFAFTYGGTYLIALDFMTDQGAYSEKLQVEVAGKPAPRNKSSAGSAEMYRAHELAGNDAYTKAILISESETDSDGYTITLSAPKKIAHGKETTLTYTVTKDGLPITDLASFLDAPMHVAVVNDDFSQFLHEHGEVAGGHKSHDNGDHHGATSMENFGPIVMVPLVFPQRGTYYLFGQVKHEGKLIVSRFMVEVE